MSYRPARAAVFSAGAWGTAFAKTLGDAGTDVVLHARRDGIADTITHQHRNPAYWPNTELPGNLTATTDPATALNGADFLVLSVPARSLRSNLQTWAPYLSADTIIVSLMKGLVDGRRASQIITAIPGLSAHRVAVVSGPNLAGEIMAEQPAAATVACADPDVARRVQQACHTGYFRPYTGTDVIGVEIGGATKNVIAVACGIAAGMGLDHNTQAMLITRGLAEITRLGNALGAAPMTFAGLAGVGDLVATCTSPLSRNRSFGADLGHGRSVDEAVATGRTAEGVASAEAIRDLARSYDVDMPITELVVDVLHDKITLDQAATALMQRSPKRES